MARIAARKPYYIHQNVETLIVKLKIYPQGGTEPTAWQYTVVKNSYKAGVPEELRINISPFMRDFFDHKPNTLPASPMTPTGVFALTVKVEVNGVEEEHIAFDGIASPTNNQYLGVSNYRPIVLPQDGSSSPLGYFSFSADNTAYLRYTTNLGIQETVPVPPNAGHLIQIAPFIPPTMDVTGAASIKVEALTTSQTIIWTEKFEIDCTYHTDESIGFINWYGVWEFFFVRGAVGFNYMSEGEEYRSFEDGYLKQYNVNLEEDVIFNTGWVEQQFYQVLQSFMIAETSIYYSGGPWSFGVVLRDKTIKRKTRRKDKMMSYTFTMRAVNKLIPIV